MPNEFFKTPKNLYSADSQNLTLISKMFYELRKTLFSNIGRTLNPKKALAEISKKTAQQKSIWDVAFASLIIYRRWITLLKVDPFTPKKPEDLTPLDLAECKEGLLEVWQQLHLDNNSEFTALSKLLDKNITIVYLILLLFPEYGLEIMKTKSIADILVAVKNPKIFTNRELFEESTVIHHCLALITKLLGREKMYEIDYNLDLKESEPKTSTNCLIL